MALAGSKGVLFLFIADMKQRGHAADGGRNPQRKPNAEGIEEHAQQSDGIEGHQHDAENIAYALVSIQERRFLSKVIVDQFDLFCPHPFRCVRMTENLAFARLAICIDGGYT